MLAHVFALEPGFDVAAGFVSTAFVGAAVQPRRLPCQLVGTGFFRLLRRVFHPGRQTFGKLGLSLARSGQGWQLILRLVENGLDDAVHQQIGISTDRAGEVCVGLVSQTEVATVHRRVNRLLHGAQQHRVDLLRVRPVLGGHRNLLELARRRVVADAHPEANGLEVVAQHVLLLGRRAFVYTKQAHMFAL